MDDLKAELDAAYITIERLYKENEELKQYILGMLYEARANR
jgi:hypothetical protein